MVTLAITKAKKSVLLPLSKVRSGANHRDGVEEWGQAERQRGDKGDGEERVLAAKGSGVAPFGQLFDLLN